MHSLPTGARAQVATAIDMFVQARHLPSGKHCLTHISRLEGLDKRQIDIWDNVYNSLASKKYISFVPYQLTSESNFLKGISKAHLKLSLGDVRQVACLCFASILGEAKM